MICQMILQFVRHSFMCARSIFCYRHLVVHGVAAVNGLAFRGWLNGTPTLALSDRPSHVMACLLCDELGI